MVVPTPSPITEQDLRTADGQVYAYVVPVEQMERMRAELASLREQLATAIRQRDHHLAKLEEVLKEYFPLPPTEQEMLTPQATSDDIARLLADLESR